MTLELNSSSCAIYDIVSIKRESEREVVLQRESDSGEKGAERREEGVRETAVPGNLPDTEKRDLNSERGERRT